MHYSTKEILKDDNLIFDLKNDIAYKRVFLNNDNYKYLALIISKIFKKIDVFKTVLLNTEIPNSKSNIKSSYSDLIIKNNTYEFIIEMNNEYSEILFYKNNHYLLKEHSRRNYRGNIYGKNNYTILVNIDNYDLLKKNKLIYKSEMRYHKYNNALYNNIKCYSINLDYVKYRYYNNYKLSELEKLLIIFIEQKKDKILNITSNKYIKELINYMDTLKMEEDYIATYDREEFEKGLKDEFENNKRKLESDKTKLENDKTKLENDKTKLEIIANELYIKENNLNKRNEQMVIEKKNIAKELKILGIPINKIMELTKLSERQINML